MQTISIIGTGRVGGALALALSKKNYQVINLFARDSSNAERISEEIVPKPNIVYQNDFENISEDIVFITTQDSEIEKIAEKLSKVSFGERTFIFHTSGSLSSESLNILSTKNCAIGSIHPLVSISDSFLGVERFRDAYFCVEGDDEAVKLANEIVKGLDGKPFSIASRFKTLYHASAVTACGHIVALIDVANEMLTNCGLKPNEAKRILMPLIESTIENLNEQKNSEALTGTFARADVKTLKSHIATIKENTTDEILQIYLQLGERSLHLAKEQGTNESRLAKMSEEISLAKKNFKC